LPEGIATGDTYIQLKIAQSHSLLIVPGSLAWWRRRSGNATEMFFKDGKYLKEVVSYRVKFLEECGLLSDAELDIARRNLYGTLLRYLIKSCLKGKWSDAIFVYRGLGLDWRILKYVYRSSEFTYFSHVSGDNPLHTSPAPFANTKF
jgi:hypothetical protein